MRPLQSIFPWSCSDEVGGQALHCHEQVEIVSVSSGEGTLRQGRQMQRTHPGALFLVAPLTVHAGCPITTNFSVRGINIDVGVFEVIGFRWEYLFRKRGLEDQRKVSRMFKFLLDALTQTGRSELHTEERLVDLLSSLSGHSSSRCHKEPSRVSAVMELLRASLCDEISLAQLAAEVGLTPAYLCRAFRKKVGLPPHAYRQRMRVARAVTLLQSGMPPREVAAAAGFYDKTHLGPNVKSQTGLTPKQVANAARISLDAWKNG